MTENVYWICDNCGERALSKTTRRCAECNWSPDDPTELERLLAFVRKIADFSGDEIGLTYYEVKELASEARDLVAASRKGKTG